MTYWPSPYTIRTLVVGTCDLMVASTEEADKDVAIQAADTQFALPRPVHSKVTITVLDAHGNAVHLRQTGEDPNAPR